MEENLPPGFRFHPTDAELISYYLTSKVSDPNGFTSKAIAVVDLNKSEPWDLPGKASMGEKQWYFFSIRDRKYPTGLRTNRATESGYWKTTGKDKPIFAAGNGVLVGMKKTLVFYEGRAPRGHKTNWVMHEYRLHQIHPFTTPKEEWVVCRVFQKSISTAKKQQETSSTQASPESPCDTTSKMNEVGDVELAKFSTTNSSTRFINNILPQTDDHNGHHHSNNVNNNVVSTNMMNLMSANWCGATHQEVPSLLPSLSSLPWPSQGLIMNPINLSVNSLLLKALQLKSYQQPNDHFASSFMSQAVSSNVGPTDVISNLTASSSNVIECMPHQQQQQLLNLDSIW